MLGILLARESIRWFYSCDKSSYIRSVYSQCHVDSLKCIEQNVNDRSLRTLYLCVFFGLKVIRSWLNMPSGGHGHVICMCDLSDIDEYWGRLTIADLEQIMQDGSVLIENRNITIMYQSM